MKRILILIALVSFLVPVQAFAHPGRTASDGCHYCRTNCGYWGVGWYVRHCHNRLETLNGVKENIKDPSLVIIDYLEDVQDEDLAKDAMGLPMGNISGFFSRGGLLGILNNPDSLGEKAEKK